ncbi:Electron transport complex protein RnfC [Pelotomaculum schinkii]|uniref:Electron transport complex protein RnfC n=1 Tax=Pelotomaculum schinkii TaxID=78350 RepID=A0A4Y7R8Y5_9FIRM|nr:Electron transport complex protein RnfC [Pelotomaculum schinkii]
MGKKIVELARQAGVVGAGGAGFPTHVKLNAQVEYLVVNGAECEPLITVDQVLILKYAARLAAMLERVRFELGAKEAIIGIKAKHKEVIAEAERVVAEYEDLRVKPLGDFYPAGDEYVLVFETTGRQIPQGGIPLECGVVVINVETLWNLAEAEEGRPVSQKWVTVAGAVANPGTYFVPLGVSTEEMLELAGGPTITKFAVINGGPMMGKLVRDLKEPVTKTTKGLLVLPETNPVIVNHFRPLTAILRQAQSMCCQCHMCTDLCPRNLLGYHINPNSTILSASYSWLVKGAPLAEALLCSECGACDMYACTMGLSPRRVNQMLKGELSRQGVKNPYKGQEATVSKWRPYRRIPTKRLLSRLCLTEYRSPVEIRSMQYHPKRVELMLKQHVGAPAAPVVAQDDWVEAGELIAKIPTENALGSNLYASISGRITKVLDDRICIDAKENSEVINR